MAYGRRVVNVAKIRSVVVPIIVVNVVFFGFQVLFPWFTELFILKGGSAFTEPWRLITSMFLHGGFGHLFFNMYALYLFGPMVEARIGYKRFLLLYFLAGFLASLGGSFIYNNALGASGAIMGVIGALIVFNPNLRLLLFFFIPMSLRTAGIFWIILDIVGVFNPGGNVANIAHLVGIVTGLVFGYVLRGKGKKQKKRFEGTKTYLNENEIDDYLKYGRL